MSVTDQACQKIIVHLQDDAGKKGTCSFHIPTVNTQNPVTAAAVTTLITDLIACTDAVVVDVEGVTYEDSQLTEPVENAYDCRDKLTVEYVDSQNGHHLMHIPDVLDSLIQAGSDYVDQSQTPWLDLVTALEGNVKDKLGQAITVLNGWRTRSRGLKRGKRLVGVEVPA
jgi:hypothetical protein